MNIFKNIVLLFLSVQEKMLLKRLSKPLNKKNRAYSNGCYLTLDSISEQERLRMEDELGLILKSCNYNPIEILEYIGKHNIKIYNLSSNWLKFAGLKTGFIYPQKGLRAFYLGLLTQKRIKFKTDEMFVVNKNNIDKYLFIYHFYNWYTYRQGIQGIDLESQKLLNKYLNSTDEAIKNLKLDEILRLKDAIKQDKCAIDFVLNLCAKFDSGKIINNLKEE